MILVPPGLLPIVAFPARRLRTQPRFTSILTLMFTLAGFGYSFFNSKLLSSYGASGLDEFTGTYSQFLGQPLVNQPGTIWEYGINLDWAGLLVTRVTGLSLNDYFQQHIFKPLGIKNLNMFPTPEMVSRLAFMNTRNNETGKLSLNLNGHIARAQLMAAGNKDEEKRIFNAGGHGLFARPTEYTRVIAMLLVSLQLHSLLSVVIALATVRSKTLANCDFLSRPNRTTERVLSVASRF